MILHDREIRALLEQGELVLQPFDDRLVQPASVDLRLDGFARTIQSSAEEIDLRSDALCNLYTDISIPEGGVVIPPGDTLIGQTTEYMCIPATCAGLIEQRSSLVRLGIHVSSSIINPGYAGNLPVFIWNATRRPLRVFAGMPICQLVLVRLAGRPSVIYSEKPDAKYHGERKFLPSKISADMRTWVAPRLRLVHPEQAVDLEKELLVDEVSDAEV